VRDLLLNNFWWKVTALLLAIVVWLGFQPRDKKLNLFPDAYQPSYVRYILRHPVTIIKPANDTREFKVTPSEVDIALSGDEKVLDRLKGSEIRASVDVVSLAGKSNTLPITVNFPHSEQIKQEQVTPDRVQVELTKE
jgi:YbbR domain-containing protein